MLYYLIFITFFITHSLHTMNEVKTNKKIKKQKITKTKDFCKIAAVQEFMLTQKIGEKYNCPKEIVNVIKQYNNALRNKAFEKLFTKSYMDVWDDFSIPKGYNQLLNTKQIDTLKSLFFFPPSISSYRWRITAHCALGSEHAYKSFLTIPIELRRYLTKMPKSMQKLTNAWGECNPDDNINKHCIIRVTTKSGRTKGKFIIPEENKKKITLDPDR